MTSRALRVFTAVDLAPTGGGIAAASRLCWQALRDRFGGDCRLVTLLDEAGTPTALDKLRFGARLIGLQAIGGARWVFFSHLGLARTQTQVPRRVQRPYGVFLHGIEVWRPLPESDLRILRRASLRVANSEFTAKRVAQLHPTIGPIVTCPLALAPEHEHLLTDLEAPTPDPAEPAVLMVGRMDAGEGYKGHAEAIAAWPHVRARVAGARLILVGDGDDVPRLRTLAVTHGVADSVEFPGFLTSRDLQNVYRRASLFLMPSRGEGFGLVYLEAMAHGLPCIGSRHDAAGDVIVDGVTGFLVDQDDASQIAARVVDMLEQRSLRARLGHAGRERVRDVFSFDRFSSRFVGAIDRHLETEGLAQWERATAVSPRSGSRS